MTLSSGQTPILNSFYHLETRNKKKPRYVLSFELHPSAPLLAHLDHLDHLVDGIEPSG
jgi:hypothetical protein